MEITRKDLKVLLCDTRLNILKSLKERRKTVSELSRELKLSKSTVHEHLSKLTDIGLVRRVESGRKWVYYELTDKGSNLLKSELWKFIIVVPIAAILAGLYEIFSFLGQKPMLGVKGVGVTVNYTPVVFGMILIFAGILGLYVLKRSVLT